MSFRRSGGYTPLVIRAIVLLAVAGLVHGANFTETRAPATPGQSAGTPERRTRSLTEAGANSRSTTHAVGSSETVPRTQTAGGDAGGYSPEKPMSPPVTNPEPSGITSLSSDCLIELFDKYGDNGKLTFKGFEKLVFNIGLGKLKPGFIESGAEDQHDHDSHHSSETSDSEQHGDHEDENSETHGDHEDEDSETHASEEEKDKTEKVVMVNIGAMADEDSFHGIFGDDHSDEHFDDHIDAAHLNMCLSPGQLIHVYGVHPWEGLDPLQFVQICPILLQQLDSHSCIKVTYHNGEGEHKMNKSDIFSIPGHVWGYGFLAITVISGVSLLGILMVPLTRRYPKLYRRLLSYLVALAVGSLAGDALLHLIPHSFAGEHKESEHESEAGKDDGHTDMVLKGLVILFGIYFFFIIERIMKYVSHRKQRKLVKQRKLEKEKEAMNHGHKHKEAMLLSEEEQRVIGERLQRHSQPYNSTQFLDLVTIQADALASNSKNYVAMDEMNPGHHHHHDNDSDDEYDDEAGGGGHGHSHNHGNLENASIASVAWMVIMGDGLHNFCDGLAIGAAFSNSLTGGLSTTIAVFCHELPHELGDFAILLSSGMRVRQAVMYSLVSSVLAYVGMFIGIGLGNINSMSLWIFAMTGGMFLYIALVDMIPEMTHAAASKNENQCCHLFLQNLGITTGISIMLIIAMFEDDLSRAIQ